ncbi:MAG: O-antigen ligase [Flavobacterium sp.]|jgi:O-antigen ligase
MLLPVTYFLGKSGKVAFFPTYLIGISLISLLGSQEVKRFYYANRSSLLLIAVFLAYLALSNIWIDQSIRTSALYIGYGLLILCFISSLAVLEQVFDNFFNSFLAILAISACLSVIYSVYFFHALDYQPLVESRLYALGGIYNPVVSALSYGAVLILALTHFATSQRLSQRLLYGVSILILTIGILYTGTRSVWIGLFVSSFVLLYFLPNITRLEKRRIIIVSQLCLIIILAVMYKFGLHESILQRSTSFRFEIWEAVLSTVWNNNLFFGHGLNALEVVRYEKFLFEHPHNIYIATLFYGGIFGLTMLVALIGKLLLSLYRENILPYRIYAISALSFGLTCLLIDGDKLLTKINFIWLLFWLPVAIAFIQLKGEKKEPNTNEAVD